MSMVWAVDTDGCVGMCRNKLYDEVKEYLKKEDIKDLITIKGKPKTVIDTKPTEAEYVGDFPCYVSVNYRWLDKPHAKKPGVTISRRVQSKCEQYMKEVFPILFDGFLIGSGHRTIEGAIAETGSFTELWDEFHEWFNVKRERYMEKMDLKIKEMTGVAPTKNPRSHGGVANLLKVLTKTMEQQGADITTIAKTQYMVCLQAGIYLPDEFLTDVAVALDYKEAIEKVERGE